MAGGNQGKGGVISGEMKNISVSGAYVQCASLPKAGEIVSVTIRPPGHKSIEIVAEVIWTAAAPPFGMGMAFMDISDEDRWFISETVSPITLCLALPSRCQKWQHLKKTVTWKPI